MAGILHLRAQADVRERVLPLGQTDVHQHQPEVMSEGFGHEMPTQGSVKEPDLRVLTREWMIIGILAGVQIVPMTTIL